MKKAIAAILTIIMLSVCLAVSAADTTLPTITSRAYTVIDASTGQVLLQRGGADAHYPASITKIMTLALALEKCGGDMSAQLTVSKDDINIERGSSHIALQAGELITLEDAFQATILMSANDAANVLASYVTDGNLSAFPDLMNAKASELGLAGTHFVNAHGLYSAEHYTTANDMAHITQYALSVPGFRELFASTSYTMKPTNKQSEQRLFGTDNCMLVTSNFKYEGTIGGKSGWVQEAGYTMVEAAERDGRTLVAVVLASDQKYDKFRDCIALFNYCFANFASTPIAGSAFDSVNTPVYGGGDKQLGDVKVNVTDFSVLLPLGMTADDIELSYNVPEKYVIGKPFAATVTAALKNPPEGMDAQLGTYPMQTSSIGEILARSTGVAAAPGLGNVGEDRWSFTMILLGGAALVLTALVGGRIAYVAYIKSMRKKRRLARMRALYGHSAPQTMSPMQKPSAQYARYGSAKAARAKPAQNLQIIVGGGYPQTNKRASQ